MTQEDKYFLIKDLCSRLPYGVVIEHVSGIRGTLHDLFVSWYYNKDDEMYKHESNTMFFGDVACDITKFKPYLVPLSSMTEEQKEELHKLWDSNMSAAMDCAIIGDELRSGLHQLTAAKKVNEWCYENHFDINGLIPMNLALDATGLNIY